MKPTTSTGGCLDTVCRADSTKKDIHGAQLRRRRFDDQALKDILKAMRLAERVLEDTLDGRENITSGCRRYGLDGNRMQYLIYGMRTILEDGKRPVSREELDHALAEYGRPDCVEQLYRKAFCYTRIGAKHAADLMPADAYDTIEYICNHPSRFFLSCEEGKVLRAIHLDGYGLEIAAENLSVSYQEAANTLKRARGKLATMKENARFLLYGMAAYRQAREETEAERKAKIKEALEARGARVMKKNIRAIKTAGLVPVLDMGLSTRATNGLMRRHIRNLHEIVQLDYKDLIGIRELGRKSVTEIIYRVREYAPGWSPEGMPENFLESEEKALNYAPEPYQPGISESEQLN